MAGNEASAIGSLRAVNSSQQAYMASCGHGFYASLLTILNDPAPTGAAFISPELGAATIITKSGYTLTMAQGTEAVIANRDGCNPSGTAANLFSSYYAANQPTSSLTAAGGSGPTHWAPSTLRLPTSSTPSLMAAPRRRSGRRCSSSTSG
jgi:hypothetical protein